MILVDTSVWIDHFHKTDQQLVNLLEEGLVKIHPFIIGELACGNIKNRKEILRLLNSLPSIKVAAQSELIYFIDNNKLYGIGLGFVDVHLLASCKIDNDKLYTRDKKLKQMANQLNIV